MQFISPQIFMNTVCVGHMDEPCKNVSADRDAFWVLTHMGPRNYILDGMYN